MPQGPFGRLAAFVLAHTRLVVLVFVALVIGSVTVSALWLRVDPDMLKLLPKDAPVTVALERLEHEEGGVNLVTVAVEGDDPEALNAYMGELARELEALESVEFALYDLDPDLAWNVGLRLLPLGDLETIHTRLQAALALGPAAQNPMIAARVLDLGPLTDKLSNPGQTAALASSGGTARVLVRPTGSANDTIFAKRLMRDVEGVLERLPAEARGLEVVWIGGPYRHNVEDLEGIQYDLRWTTFASLFLVFAVVAGAFRDLRALVLVFVPLIAGNALTFGFVTLVIGSLNTFTSIFSAVLLGLGIDFGVHLYARYRERRMAGLDVDAAIISAWDLVGPPCGAAALTSMGGFLALWAAGFHGFQQLGTILAVGILFCLVSVLFLLPLLIHWREGGKAAVPLTGAAEWIPKSMLSYRAAPMALAFLGVLTVGAGTFLPQVEFQYDLSELRRQGMSFADLGEEERTLAQDSYTPVVLSYDTDDELHRDHVRLSELVATGGLPEVGRVLSVYSLLPEGQQEHIAVLGRIQELARSPNTVYLPQAAQKNLERLAQARLEVMGADTLPASVRAVLGSPEGRHRLLLIPSGNMWDLRETAALKAAIARAVPDREAAGNHLAMATLFELVKGDGPRVAGVALVLVYLSTLFDLRRPLRALGAILALIAGMCWAGAALAVAGVKVSMMNFVGLPILLGIGVDVVIHLLHRIAEEGPGGIRTAIRTTGWAVAVSTITTIVSFAALSFASSEGVRSLGLIIAIGLTFVALSAYVVVPVGWMAVWQVLKRHPGDGTPEAE